MAIETASTTITKPTPHRVWCTYVITAICIYVFQQERHAMGWGIMGSFLEDYAFQWTRFLLDPLGQGPQLITSTFLHANTEHLVGNMVFFLAFAPAVERRIGGTLFALVYFAAGAAAALTNGYFEPFVPALIGASGAISGVMGAHLVLYPLQTPFKGAGRYVGNFLRHVPVFVWIGIWFLIQLKSGVHTVLRDPTFGTAESVAYWAHVGGFVFGAASMLPFIAKR